MSTLQQPQCAARIQQWENEVTKGDLEEMTSSNNKEALLGLLKSKKLEPYVRHIRFPQYKNLAADTRVDFSYPISALGVEQK